MRKNDNGVNYKGGKVNKKQNSNLTRNAQRLRKGMTKEERHLWFDFLKDLPINFNRQKVIGQYIVDFYCASANLVVELDGSQHFGKEGFKMII
jgi:very-short-patch-repair endonuclease